MYTLGGFLAPGLDVDSHMDPRTKNLDIFMFAFIGALGWYYFLGGKKKMRKSK